MNKPKKTIVFGTDDQVKGIGSILQKNGMEVVEVPTVNAYQPLITAVKQHRDADLIILCGKPLDNKIAYPTQEVHRQNAAPILAVLGQWRFPDEPKVIRAGAAKVLHSRDVIEDKEVAVAAGKMLGLTICVGQAAQQHLKLVKPEAASVSSVPHGINPRPAETAKAGTSSVSLLPELAVTRSMDEIAELLLATASALEAQAKTLRQHAEEMLPSARRQQVNPQSVPTDPILTIGEIVMKGRMVTFCGKTFHLPHQQVKILDTFCRNRNNGGVSKELLRGLGLKTSTAISVAVAGLRERLEKVCPSWEQAIGRCQNGSYPFRLPT